MDLSNSRRRLVLFFPPIHDFAMPHLSLPSLQGFVKANSKWLCKSIDLNLAFFKWVLQDSFDELWSFSKNSIKRNAPVDSVGSILELQKKTDELLLNWSSLFPGYVLSSRKLKTPFDQNTSQGISIAVVSSANVFIDITRELIIRESLEDTDLFGVNLSVEDQIIPGLTLCQVLRDNFPNSKIVIGGTLATRLQNGLLSKPLKHLFDYLIIREGEEPLLALLNAIEQQIHPKDPRVFCSESEMQNQLPEITNLEKLPSPDFDDFNPNEYLSPYSIVPISLGRKCSWGKCDFCSIHTSWDPSVRFRPLKAAIQDVQFYLEKYGVSHYRIVDESPPISKLIEFSTALLENNLSIKYEAYCRLDSELDRKAGRILSESGCRQLFFGLESIESETLRMVNKGYSVSKIRNILAATASEEIVNYVFVLVGIPGAPVADERVTLSFLVSDPNVHSVALASFVVDRNAPIHLCPSIAGRHSITVFEEGDMTTEIGYKSQGLDPRFYVKKRATELTKELYERRPDIAVMSLMNEEHRFALACNFGNKFAQEFVESSKPNEINSIVSRAITKGVTERIVRNLEK